MSFSKKNSTRLALLRSREELFSEKGYAAKSTREPAEKARVNLGTIQSHYYPFSRAFIARLRGFDYTIEPQLTRVCRNISEFTLRGIGLGDEEIGQALTLSYEMEAGIT